MRPHRTESACVVLATLLLAFTVATHAATTNDYRGRQFKGWSDFASFTTTTNTGEGTVTMLSPVVTNTLAWNELIASWNVRSEADGWMKIEARAFLERGPTQFYTLGLWSENSTLHPRASVAGQKDSDGDVLTDTLVLQKVAEAFQLRITLGPAKNTMHLKFLAVCVANTEVTTPPLMPNRKAWGITLTVPEVSQMPYTNGVTLCSPATVAMLLGFWARELKRPELAMGVPEIAREVYDTTQQGVGNWSFNMACAGAQPGLRGCVARFSDIAEIEDWVAAGFPVGLSVCYNRLRGKGDEPSGHLVVCVGFTKTGDPIVNDPGTTLGVRKIFPRANLIRAWAYSKNTVYLVFPEAVELPPGKYAHW